MNRPGRIEFWTARSSRGSIFSSEGPFTMNLKLHYHIASTYCQKVILAFYEKGVEFTPVHVNLFDDAARAEYKKLYPLAKIPLLTGDDLFIPESTIIIEYLENEFPNSGTQLIPDDKTAARRVRFKDRVYDNYLNNPVSTLFFESQKPTDKRSAETDAKARQTLETVYQLMEKSLADNAFLSGASFSMADCAAFAPLFYAQKLHPYRDQKNLTAYFGRMMQRPSVQKLLKDLLPALEKYNKK
jgi:glutathione S-transferase